MRYLLTFSYDGSKFHGFQRQKNTKSIQGTLEVTLSKILDENLEIKGAGRTDAGVHAICQTAHFEYQHDLPKNFKKILNTELNEEIVIKKIKKVNNDFHARFSVKEKTYKYVINIDKEKVNNLYYFTTFNKLNINEMKKAAIYFIGVHDFRNFVSGKRDDYTTYIKTIKIKEMKNFIIIEFTGVGFYRYMVRHLAGALYDIGRGKATKENINTLLTNLEVNKKLSVLPAYGLYLVKVKY